MYWEIGELYLPCNDIILCWQDFGSKAILVRIQRAYTIKKNHIQQGWVFKECRLQISDWQRRKRLSKWFLSPPRSRLIGFWSLVLGSWINTKKNQLLVTCVDYFVSSVDKKLACVVSYGSSGQQEEELQSIACYFLVVVVVVVVVVVCFFS